MTTTIPKEALEVRLNSEDDARDAATNFIFIQREAERLKLKRIVFLVERTLSREIHTILGSFFRKLPTSYAYMESPPSRVFFKLPRITIAAAPADTGAPEGGVPLSIAQDIVEEPPVVVPRKKPGRPRKNQVLAEQAA